MRSIRVCLLASVLILGVNHHTQAQWPGYYGAGVFPPYMPYPLYPWSHRYGYGGWYGWGWGYYRQTYNNLPGVGGAINNAIIIPNRLERQRAAAYKHEPVHWCPYHRRLEPGRGTRLPYRY